MSSDESFIGDYEREFAGLVPKITATGKDGKLIGGTTEGVILAKGYMREVEGNGRKVMLVGNGASASIASHMATDFWNNAGIRATAFNDSSLLTCVSNDYSFVDVFRLPIEKFADNGDMLICISSSGQSANILNAAHAGLDKGCWVITLSGFEGENPLRGMGHVNFHVPSPRYGPVEVLHTYILHCLSDLLAAERY